MTTRQCGSLVKQPSGVRNFNVSMEEWTALKEGQYDHQLFIRRKFGIEVDNFDPVVFYPTDESIVSDSYIGWILFYWMSYIPIKQITSYPKKLYRLKFVEGKQC